MIVQRIMQIYGRYWPYETKNIKLHNGSMKQIHHKFRKIDQLRKKYPIKKWLITKFDENIKIFLNPDDLIGWQIFYLGQYEENTTNLIKKIIKKNMVFFDVGGNIGYYSLLAAKRGAYVHTFEASQQIGNLLKKNKRINNFNNMNIENSAIYDKDTVLRFQDPQKGNLGTGKVSTNYGKQVRAIRLDSFIKQNAITNVDLMKIDVEGVELNVLNGAKKILQNFHPDILCEKNDEGNVERFLNKLDYKGYYIRKGKGLLTKKMEAPNMFFTCKPEKYSDLMY